MINKTNFAIQLLLEAYSEDGKVNIPQMLEALQYRVGEVCNKFGKLNKDMDILTLPKKAEKVSIFEADKLAFVPKAAKDQWDDIEINGCAVVDDKGSVEVVDEDAEFYSVYLHQTAGGIQCIADLPTQKLALQVADLIENAVKNYKDNGYLVKRTRSKKLKYI